MGWLRITLLAVLASIVIDLIAQAGLIYTIGNMQIATWVPLRIIHAAAITCYVGQVCHIRQMICQQLRDQGRDAAYSEIYAIAQNAIQR